MPRLKGTLFGMGVMGSHHARLLSSSESLDFLAIYDPFLQQPDYKGVSVHREISAILDLSPDFAIIASPTGAHYELGMLLIEAGIHLLVEKPLASSASEAKALLQAVKATGTHGAVGHIERFNPAIIRMKELLDANLLGEIYQISTIRTGPFPSRVTDVGVGKDLASHDIDLVLWLSSSSYRNIEARTKALERRSNEDFYIAIGTLDSGVLVSHSINWRTPIKERETRVVGEKGMLIADTLKSELYFHETGNVSSPWDQSSFQRGPIEGNSTRFALSRVEPVLSEHLAFESMLLGKASSIATFQDGVKVLEALEHSMLGS